VLVLVALLVPAAVGVVVGRAAVAPVAQPAAVQGMRVIARAGLDVLDRPQSSAERRGAPTASGIVPTSVRRIGTVHSVEAAVQLARTTSGQVCLLAAVKSGRQFTASCGSREAVERDGLTVQFSITAWAAVRLFSERGVLPRFITLVWTPDGRLRLDERTDASA
jgi:hypothetical protein